MIAALFLGIVGMSALFRGGIGPPPRRTDLTVFLRAAQSLQTGEHIYLVSNARGWFYVYTPLLAIMLIPFWKLPLLLNSFIWYMLSAGSLCGSVYLAAKLSADGYKGMRAAVMAALFCVPSLMQSMTRGQLGVMSVFLAVAILYLYAKRRDAWAGLLFAFSVVLKISPLAPLGLLFLVKRDWKVLLWACAGGLIFLFIVPSVVLGFDQNWFYLTEWHRVLSQAASDNAHNSHLWEQLLTPFAADNQSLTTAITRWIYPDESALLASGNSWIKWVVRGSGGLFILALAFFSRRKRAEIDVKRLMLEYSLFPVWMLIFAPVSEIHHYTMLFIMFFPALLYLQGLSKTSIAYQSLMWGVLIAFSTHICGYIQPLDYWGLPVLGSLIFWLVSFIFIARNRTESPA